MPERRHRHHRPQVYRPSRHLEFRAPDPTCNPYLSFAAMLMAGIDGVINEIEPPDPVDQNLYEMSAVDLAMIRQVPGSLDQALAELERDYEFLLRGGVFTEDLIGTWLDYKRNDVDAMRLRPHPHEFFLYLDA